LRRIEFPGEMHVTGDYPSLSLKLQCDVYVYAIQRPSLALGIHPQGDDSARAERGAKEFVWGRAEILAARCNTLVGG
jgi:hypothetical protein